MGITNSQLAKTLRIAYYCPENYNKIQFTLDYLQTKINADWTVVLLGVGGGYLSVDSIVDFASRESKYTFHDIDILSSALSANSSDSADFDSFTKDVVLNIDLETWALAFEKLFYVAACWLIENVDFNNSESKDIFQLLWDDFYFIRVGNMLVYFVSPEDCYPVQNRLQTNRIEKENWLEINCHKFISDEKTRLQTLDFHNPSYHDSFEHIIHCWSMRYYEEKPPLLIESYSGGFNGIGLDALSPLTPSWHQWKN